MTKKKDHLIGIRFTKEERNLIENYAQERNCTITEFIRESIFSHIHKLSDDVGNLDVDDFLFNFNKIEKSAEIVLKSIALLKKKLDVYDFKRLNYNLTKEETSSGEVKEF